MNDETSPEPATVPCRYCGNDAGTVDSGTEHAATNGKTDVYQVIVLCAACHRPFATIARN